jgi:hypothetical protein
MWTKWWLQNDEEQRMRTRLTVFYHFVFYHFVPKEQWLARARECAAELTGKDPLRISFHTLWTFPDNFRIRPSSAAFQCFNASSSDSRWKRTKAAQPIQYGIAKGGIAKGGIAKGIAKGDIVLNCWV